MNGFNLSTISDCYIGSAKASAIYKGSTLIWSATHDYSRDYFTIESLADYNTISFIRGSSAPQRTIEYSLDGITWTSLTPDWGTTNQIAYLQTGGKVMVRGNNTQYATAAGKNSNSVNRFSSSQPINVYGNIMSLVYGANFIGQTSLTASYTFNRMFSESKIVNAENLILPATTLQNYCYYYMFDSSPNLAIAPSLPATTLTNYCYYYMFTNCTSLVSTPTLPATTLADYCYSHMFHGCTSLTIAPNINGTTAAPSYCSYMFKGCTSLVAPPALRATTLADFCYNFMFEGCTDLVHAPSLPATVLSKYCYQSMFNGCTNVNDITCYATDISAKGCTNNWLSGVSETGNFYKPASMNDWTTGTSGIPTNWTVHDIS